MVTKPNLTLTALKSMFVELLLNKTDKVSDVSDDSILNGFAFGAAKVGQKAIKDIAITEAKIFPDYAVGDYLDESAKLFGVSERKGALGSSTYVKVIASEGTQYLAGTHTFTNQSGIIFEIEESVTVGSLGYEYIKVRSIDSGVKTNVAPNTIISVSPRPVTHIAVSNEYYAVGGVDAEDDDLFRIRIKNNNNILSVGTLEYLTQVFQSFDDRILRVINLGVNNSGKRVLSIVTQNGVGLSGGELTTLLDNSTQYFPICDLNRFGDTIGIELQNAEFYYVGGNDGIDFRVDISTDFDSDQVRIDIQTGMSKYLDFRFWTPRKKVEWDNLLDVVKGVDGVRYVPDLYFKPRVDEIVPINKLPRIKKFIMRDLDGNIIFDSAGVLSPVFYTV